MTLPALDSLQVSPELIRRIALGIDPPVDIAAAFGIDEPTYRAMEQEDWFRNRVLSARAEIEASGGTRIERQKHIYDVVLEVAATEAMTDKVPFAQKLQFLDHLANNAGLKPKSDGPVGGGSGSSITIVIGQQPAMAPAPPEVHTIDVVPTKKIENAVTLKFGSSNADIGAGEVYDDG